MKKWEHFNHDADIGIRGKGKDAAEAFEMAAKALTAVITSLSNVSAKSILYLSCEANDLDILFYDWINALVFEMDIKNMLFCDYKVNINQFSLNAVVSGEPACAKKHQPAVIVKGATMTELRVEKKGGIWIAQCVVDT